MAVLGYFRKFPESHGGNKKKRFVDLWSDITLHEHQLLGVKLLGGKEDASTVAVSVQLEENDKAKYQSTYAATLSRSSLFMGCCLHRWLPSKWHSTTCSSNSSSSSCLPSVPLHPYIIADWDNEPARTGTGMCPLRGLPCWVPAEQPAGGTDEL